MEQADERHRMLSKDPTDPAKRRRDNDAVRDLGLVKGSANYRCAHLSATRHLCAREQPPGRGQIAMPRCDLAMVVHEANDPARPVTRWEEHRFLCRSMSPPSSTRRRAVAARGNAAPACGGVAALLEHGRFAVPQANHRTSTDIGQLADMAMALTPQRVATSTNGALRRERHNQDLHPSPLAAPSLPPCPAAAPTARRAPLRLLSSHCAHLLGPRWRRVRRTDNQMALPSR